MKRILWVSLALTVLALALWFGFRLYERASAADRAPEITFGEEQMHLSITAGDAELLADVRATDAEDGDLSGQVFVESISRMYDDGSVKVTYVVFDSDKNAAKATRKLFYTDYVSPVFRLSEPLIGTVSNISELAGTMGAYDCIDGDLSSVVKVTYLDRLATTVGTYPVEFRVTNSLGETVYLETELECAPAGFNNARITLSDYLVYLTAGSSFDPLSYVVSYLRDGTLVTGADGLSVASGVDPSLPGVYAVTYSYDTETTSSHTRLLVVVTEGKEGA